MPYRAPTRTTIPPPHAMAVHRAPQHTTHNRSSHQADPASQGPHTPRMSDLTQAPTCQQHRLKRPHQHMRATQAGSPKPPSCPAPTRNWLDHGSAPQTGPDWTHTTTADDSRTPIIGSHLRPPADHWHGTGHTKIPDVSARPADGQDGKVRCRKCGSHALRPKRKEHKE